MSNRGGMLLPTVYLHYKGYIGRVTFSKEDRLFSGSIMDTSPIVSFDGDNAKTLEKAFRDAVDEYLASPGENGE